LKKKIGLFLTYFVGDNRAMMIFETPPQTLQSQSSMMGQMSSRSQLMRQKLGLKLALNYSFFLVEAKMASRG
jgi:hypothetical protein